MKKYRLGYDQVFLAHPGIKMGNEVLGGVTLDIQYKLFDIKSGLEIAFTDKDQSIGKGVQSISEYAEIEDYYMSDFLKCSFDKNHTGYVKFEIKNEETLKQWNYRLEYEISSYSKDIYTDDSCICAEPKEITKEEFYKILSENISNFDNIDNTLGTQSCSYTTYPIEENKENEEDMKKYVVEIVVASNQKRLYLTEGGCTTDIKKAKIYRNIRIAEGKLIEFCFEHSHSGALQGTIIEIKNQEE